jgi:hypothetical protein
MSADEREPRIAETLANLIKHPLRQHLLFRYIDEVTSPSRIAAEWETPLNVVSYHTQVMLKAGAVELVRKARRRGTYEHFYRAVLPWDIEDVDWITIPVKLRRVLSRTVIDGGVRDAADALAAGGMDGASTHVSRSYFVLDEQGRRELASVLRAALVRANTIDEDCRARGAAEATPHEVVIMSFQRSSSP